MKVAEYFEECSDAVVTREFTCGVEFEIEDIRDYGDVSKFVVENDDSLRNNGKEFKTHPSTFEETIGLFDILWKNIKVGKQPFSERTSIHVHVNVSQLTLVEAREFVLLYALLEPLFFKFAGDERKNNIFCVPLNYTYLPTMYKNDIGGLHQKWHKYTAFNVLPVSTLGTFEFRHMYGTNDKETFNTWLSALNQLYCFIESTENFSTIGALKTMPPCDIARMVVPVLCEGLSNMEINTMLNDSQLDVKLSVGGLK